MLAYLFMFFLVFITGTCIGSFLNVVVLRAFSGESIVLPPSKCPQCNNRLKWYHNIPILSYIFLKGKCAFCKKPISIQYPIVEFVTGVLFLALFFKFGFNLIKLLFMWYFVSIFVVLAVCDLKEKVIFDVHTYFLIIGGLIFNFFNIGYFYIGAKEINIGAFSIFIQNSFIASVIGLLLGVIIMEALARLGYLFAGTRAFGEGDSYIAAGLGAILGWKYLLYALFYSILIQAVFAIPVLIKKLYSKHDNKSLIIISLFIVSIFLTKLAQNNAYLYLASVLSLIIFGIWTCARILKGLKNNDTQEENLTYLPFGPAMIFAALLIIFLG